jgi:hypothetical protein
MTMGSHQSSIGKSQVYFTPRWITTTLGPFPSDVTAGRPRPWDIGTERNITARENSLTMNWRGFGRTWCNPPFDRRIVGAFVEKMCLHNHGVLLVHVRTETEWFKPIWHFASAILFLSGRVIFYNVRGKPYKIQNPKAKHYGKVANSGAPVALCAFGARDAEILRQFDGIEHEPGRLSGSFVPLIIPRTVLVRVLEDRNWRELVVRAIAGIGTVRVVDLYAVIAQHPRARRNPNWRAKIRQTLQRGRGKEFVHLGRDCWAKAS